MNAVKLTVTRGVNPGKEYVFADRTVCKVGRARDCDLAFPHDLHLDVSRHHCMLDIDPPLIRIRDLGSRNGTYINGVKIGARPQAQDTAAAVEQADLELREGDEIQIGSTVFRVHVSHVTGEATLMMSGQD